MLRFLFILLFLGVGGFFGYQYYERYLEEQTDPRAIAGYMPLIIKTDADQVRRLLESGKKNSRPTLFYVFETDCFLCRWYMNVAVDFSKQYTRQQLNVVVLSLDSSPETLARYLHSKDLQVRPLILKEGEREKLFGHLRGLGSTYDGSLPHFSVINKAGHFDDFSMALNMHNKLNGFILRSLDVSS